MPAVGNVTSHALATTPNSPWVDVRTEQSIAGIGAGAVAVSTKTNAAAVADYADKPVYAFETSWEGRGKLTPDQTRTGAWGSVMGGAFYNFAEGFDGIQQADGSRVNIFGNSQAFPHIQRMNDFIYGLRYWELNPNNGLVNSGSLCLAKPGQEYVVYRQTGGTVSVNLTEVSGTFKVEWLNPRTGDKISAVQTTGGEWRSFTAADADDWVLHIIKT
jgi:Putative collagen-binding domain of a collagenase